GIEQKVEERQKEQINQYDISSSIELGKLFPEKSKVSIPLYVGVSKTIINPEFDPKDPDVKYKDVLNDFPGQEDEIKERAQDYTSRKSINATNVRWNKNLKKMKVISPANFGTTLSYSETYKRNYNTEYDRFRKYGGSLGYNFNTRPKNIKPLSKSKALRKPAFRIIRDFNFNPYPSSFTFTNTFNRSYQENKLRDVDGYGLKIDSTVNKDFSWIRNYSLRWDLSRELKLNYSATNTARILEPAGGYDLFGERTVNEDTVWGDVVWENMYRYGGHNMDFTQTFDASYNIPINKIPIFNWTRFNTSYKASYFWTRGDVVTGRELGHNLRNSNSFKATGNFNLKNLYNKVGYLKKLEAKYTRNQRNEEDIRYKTVTYTKRTFFKANVPKNIHHKLKTTNVEVQATNSDGNEMEVEVTVVDENKVAILAAEDLTGINVLVTGKIEKGMNPAVFIAENSLRALLGFKSFNVTYSRDAGTVLPGYLNETYMMGMDYGFNAPGWPFILGHQDYDFPYQAAESYWLTTDSTFNKEINFSLRETFNFRSSFEPFRGFKIDLTATRSYTETQTQKYFYAYESVTQNPDWLGFDRRGNHYFDNRYKGGNFSISVITIGSAFEGDWFGKYDLTEDYYSESFEKLKSNRSVISSRLRDKSGLSSTGLHQIDSGYSYGYSSISQDVLIPAFYSAYTGIDPSRVAIGSENYFNWFMLPNWRMNFNGLSRLDFVKEYAKAVNISHSYKSTYNIGNFVTNSAYFEEVEQERGIRDLYKDNPEDYISKYMISNVSISEQLTPLIGIDITWINDLKTRFEIRRTRNLSLSLNNNQLTETKNKDFVIGAGYRLKDVPLNITTASGRRQFESDVNLKFDLAVRDNITIIRSMTLNGEYDRADATVGARKYTMSFTADYMFTDNFNMQFYFDYTKNSPYTSETYLNSEWNVGVSLRLSL
ncbi:MAG: cell surface protein SprA, partial [Bacteroidales bacterium]|nr:cell surface protein SprA [Bacteroidales bacterium]